VGCDLSEGYQHTSAWFLNRWLCNGLSSEVVEKNVVDSAFALTQKIILASGNASGNCTFSDMCEGHIQSTKANGEAQDRMLSFCSSSSAPIGECDDGHVGSIVVSASYIRTRVHNFKVGGRGCRVYTSPCFNSEDISLALGMVSAHCAYKRCGSSFVGNLGRREKLRT
jgi:hypothetical protein